MKHPIARPLIGSLGRIFLLLCAVMTAFSQIDRGNVEGLITDQSGAVIPGAKVQVIGIDTNSTLELATNSEGLYIVPNVPQGKYRIVVQKEGFATVTREPVEVRPSVRTRVDLTLQPGTVSESVTVSTEAPMLDTTPIANGAGLKGDQIQELPFISNGGTKRDVSQYLNYLPPTYSGAGTTEIFVDGAPATELIVGMAGRMDEVGPSVETVGEMNVVSNAFNAEYGGFANSFTNVTVRSGNNDVHGSVFNHVSNDAFNARSFFQPKKMPYRQNEGGFTFSGPLVLPHIYNGRNKTFFFGSLGWFFSRYGAGGALMTIPTQGFMKGDFSGLLNNGAQVPVFDPASAASDGTRSQFPGNVIPSTRITSFGKLMQQYMPTPTLPGITNNFNSMTPGAYWPMMNTWLPLIKVDHSISDKQKITGSYTYQYRPRVLQQNGMTKVPAYGQAQTNPLDYTTDQIANSWKIRLNDNYIVTPTMINYVALSFDRYYNQEFNKTTGQGWDQKLGITGIPSDDGAFAPISFTGGLTSPGAWGRGWHQNWHDVRYSIIENLTWVNGKHSMKFGTEIDRDIINDQNTSTAAGSFQFSNRMTSQPNNTAQVANWGNSYASFLLGAVNQASATMAPYWGLRRIRYGLFAQDEWHATRKLTLSYGLRWDFDPPFSEVHNQMSSFQANLANPGAGGRLGALGFIGTGAGRIGGDFQDSWKKGFGPRLGIAYQLDAKTVVRLSAGIYHGMSGNGTSASTAGFGNTPSFTSADQATPLYYLEGGTFPQTFQRPPLIDPSFLNGQAITLIPRDGTRLPETYSWTIGIQREMLKGTTVELNYIGNHSVHTGFSANFNYMPIDNLKYGSTLTKSITSPEAVAAGFTSPYASFATQTGANTVYQSLRPYPQYTGVTTGGFGAAATSPNGQTKYNSLQAKATKRMSKGLTLFGYVTWAKSFTLATAQYPGTRYMQMDNLSALTFSTSWTYELPFGKGKSVLDTNSKAVNAIVSGWKVNGLVRYASGLPLSITGAAGTMSSIGYGQWATAVSGVSPYATTNPRQFDPATSKYLNAAAFASTTGFNFGNIAPNASWVRGFWSKQESVTLGRIFRIREKASFDFSMDAMNPFNFHRWSNPSTNLVSATTFGKVTAAGDGRLVQFNGTLKF
jgi:hypothetical protein